MSERKPIPVVLIIAKAVCPVCKKPSYSLNGVHPRCSVANANAQMRASLKAQELPVKPLVPKKSWTKICPECRRQIPARRAVCDCGQEFQGRTSSSVTVGNSSQRTSQRAPSFSNTKVQAMAITPVGDATITRQVQGKLAGRGLGPPCRITVSTNKGAVTLSGTVQQEAQKGSALQLARAVGGVKQVLNQLTVKAREKF